MVDIRNQQIYVLEEEILPQIKYINKNQSINNTYKN